MLIFVGFNVKTGKGEKCFVFAAQTLQDAERAAREIGIDESAKPRIICDSSAQGLAQKGYFEEFTAKIVLVGNYGSGIPAILLGVTDSCLSNTAEINWTPQEMETAEA